jgi:DNA polymerase-1
VRLTSAACYELSRMDALEREIIRMEQNGFKLDVGYCETAAALARTEEAVCLTELTKVCGRLGWQDEVNWASPVQVVKLLHEHLGLPPSPVWKKGRVKLKDGERKTDETSLNWIREKVSGDHATLIDELIRLRRLRGSIKYLGKLPGYVAADGFVHPVSGPAMDADDRSGTITWRLASKNPEVMQIPTDPRKDFFRIRRAFVAPPGHKLLVADETALEAVIFGHVLVELFDDHQIADLVAPGAPDLHSVNARLVFGEYLGWTYKGRNVKEYPLEYFKSEDHPYLCQLRQDIKAIWYGLMYGKTAYGFATSLRDQNGNPIGQEAAERIVAALYAAIPGIPRYQAYVLDYILTHHGIPGLLGAWCDLSELTKSGDKWKIARAARIAQDYPMQEGGARVIGHAMVEIGADAHLNDLGLRIERQIHDELDFRYPVHSDVRAIKAGVERHMTSFPLSACLSVKMGIGDNWDQCKGN